jgi:hypothetical protein
MKTIEDVKAASMKELVAFYNAHNADNLIKKFADRKTAERRVMAVIGSLAIIEAQGGDIETGELAKGITDEEQKAIDEEEKAAVYRIRASRQVTPEEESPNAHIPEEEITEEQARAELEQIKAAASKGKPVSKSSGISLSAAIAASWADPVVADKRMTRNGVTVTVNGKSAEFKSVRAAFEAFKLPDSKHIRFRMLVKKEGKAVFEWTGIKYLFVLDSFNGEA